MKKILPGLIILIALAAEPGRVFALLTQPVANDASDSTGIRNLSAGAILSSDVRLYGGRFTYGLANGVELFGGGGLANPTGFDSAPFFQAGATYPLPFHDWPVKLALRPALGFASFSRKILEAKQDMDVWAANVSGLIGKDFQSIRVYGFGGLGYQKLDMKLSGFGSSSSDSNSAMYPIVGCGAFGFFNDQLSCYVEYAYTSSLADRAFVRDINSSDHTLNLGIRYTF